MPRVQASMLEYRFPDFVPAVRTSHPGDALVENAAIEIPVDGVIDGSGQVWRASGRPFTAELQRVGSLLSTAELVVP